MESDISKELAHYLMFVVGKLKDVVDEKMVDDNRVEFTHSSGRKFLITVKEEENEQHDYFCSKCLKDFSSKEKPAVKNNRWICPECDGKESVCFAVCINCRRWEQIEAKNGLDWVETDKGYCKKDSSICAALYSCGDFRKRRTKAE
ncbi:MAG: hypothetical protein ACYC2U_08265 [Candidatus Amoebophilus sp.]